jgi:type IV pilus biogenesis protein CpaD/CtpE
MGRSLSLLFISRALLAGCQIYDPTPTPDYTIRVTPIEDGMAALPPTCPSWVTAVTDPYDNQPLPQYGCANARNLALMIDRPKDLLHGRDMGPSSGVTTVGAMRRYNSNQSRGLIDPSSQSDTSVSATTAPTSSSPMTGETASTPGGGP